VRTDGAKLTVYFSERARADGGAFLSDRLIEHYSREQIHTSVLLRGSDGFGVHHRLHTDRLLSGAENLPAVSIAVDGRERIEAVLPGVLSLAAGAGLVTLERALVLDGPDLERPPLPADAGPDVKLTLYGGRRARANGQAGYVTAVDRLAEMQATGASILLAVDGTLHGRRRRARFWGRNADVPMMALAVGTARRIAAVLPELARLFDTPVATLERVRICRAGGRRLGEPVNVPALDHDGRPNRQKLTIHIEEGAAHDGRPIHSALLLALQSAGLAGLTTLRGVRGFYDGREPFADRLLSVRRGAPVVMVIIDTPGQIRAHWPLINTLTAEHGLVTSERVPTSSTAS
jgi:PII-like signaling protein